MGSKLGTENILKMLFHLSQVNSLYLGVYFVAPYTYVKLFAHARSCVLYTDLHTFDVHLKFDNGMTICEQLYLYINVGVVQQC